MAKNIVYVCSKLASDNAYTTYVKGTANDHPRKDQQVLIKGGSGVIDKKGIVTPHGVVTQITSDELELLRKNCPSFRRHEKAKFIIVLDKDPSVKDVKSLADDMPDDKSKQKTEEDVKKKKKAS